MMDTDRDLVAIEGFDPVSYFVAGEPRKGKSSTREEVDGAVFLFESDANRAAFQEAPEKYTPAYGGFCAYGMRFGQRSKVDPHSWKIVDDRLYLLLNKGTMTIWNKSLSKNIDVADKVWGKWQEKQKSASGAAD